MVNWYLATHDKYQSVYVRASCHAEAIDILEQYRHIEKGFKLEEVQLSGDYSDMLDNPEPPYQSIELNQDGHIVLHEKEVNQAVSKGIYTVVIK